MNLESTLHEIIQKEGFKLYDIQIAKENDNKIYRVFITKDQGISLDDCAYISNIISPIIDLDPPLQGKYFLEVSSPGIERKLTKPSHFLGSINDKIIITLHSTENIIGTLIKADELSCTLIEEDSKEISIKYEDIQKAKTYVVWE